MTEQVAQHYGKGGLLDRILGALAQAGKDIDHLTIDDLAPVDEFHSRRRLATQELAAMMAPSAADHVIDIGSGLGGPSRYLAATYGCRVSGVDLTPEFVETAIALTARVGLSDRSGFPRRFRAGPAVSRCQLRLCLVAECGHEHRRPAALLRRDASRPASRRTFSDPGRGDGKR